MSSLGDLLLSHLKPHKDDESTTQDAESEPDKVLIERVDEEKNNEDDRHSNASSTDDYVRELLDPDDRPRNVWHVVKGPTKEQADFEGGASGDHDQTVSKKDDNGDSNVSDNESCGMDLNQKSDEEPTNGMRDGESVKHGHSEQQKVEGVEDERSGKADDLHRNDKNRDRSTRRRRHHDDHDRDDRRRDRDHDRTKDRERDRYSSRARDDYERDRDRHRSRRRYDNSDDEDGDRRRSQRDRRRSRSRSRLSSRRRERSRSNSQSPITKRNSRTILVMQLNPKVRSLDLEEFFSDVGKVREVRLIMDSKTRRHKGIAYIEFEDAATAAKAFELSGKKFFGAPIVIQSAQSDRYRSSSDQHSSSTSQTLNHATTHTSSRSHLPPNCYRVYVGGLNVNLTEDMIRSVFEPFGPLVRLELMRDRVTNIPRGYAFITYAYIEDGQNAVKCLDGLELGGKAIRVSKSTDKSERTATSGNEGDSGRAGGHHDSDSDGRSSRTKDVTASLYELAGHQGY